MISPLDMEAVKRRHAAVAQKFADLMRPSGADISECHADRRDLIAEVERLMAWRPIESAPKDGAAILAWCPMVDEAGPRIVAWEGGYWCRPETGFSRRYAPTYWLPLPAPPRTP